MGKVSYGIRIKLTRIGQLKEMSTIALDIQTMLAKQGYLSNRYTTGTSEMIEVDFDMFRFPPVKEKNVSKV